MDNKVLVIEDDAVILEFIELLLQQRDFEVVGVDNGNEGIRLAQQYSPNIILSDLNMPGGDGLSVLRSVRGSPHTQDIPFILVTASLSPEARAHCFALGADQVVLKPFDPDALVDLLAKTLNKARASAMRSPEVAGHSRFGARTVS